MRGHILSLLLLTVGCKAISPVPSGENKTPYSEDISIYTEAFPPTEFPEKKSETIEWAFPLQQNMEIDSVLRILVSKNKAKKYWDGFIIQVYTGSSRSDAEKVLGNFKTEFPEIPCYLQYYQPVYRVRAGQYFDRLEATRILEEIKIKFPRSLMLPEKLPLPYARVN